MSKKSLRRLSSSEEFTIMHAVLDKFLWLGVVFVGLGLWKLLDSQEPLWYLLVGVIVLILFAWIIVREFERIR